MLRLLIALTLSSTAVLGDGTTIECGSCGDCDCSPLAKQLHFLQHDVSHQLDKISYDCAKIQYDECKCDEILPNNSDGDDDDDASSDFRKKPNVLIYLFDDAGYSDFGLFGSPLIETPNIDEISRNGLRFTNVTNYAYCNPTRAALLTGLYPHQTGGARVGQIDQFTALFKLRENASDFDSRGYNSVVRSFNTFSLGEEFLRNGYHTAIIGKTHWGDPIQATNAAIGAVSPLEQGFEYFYGQNGNGDVFDPARFQRSLLPDNIPRDSDIAEGSLLDGTYTRRFSNAQASAFYEDLANFPYIPQTFSKYTTMDDYNYKAVEYIENYRSDKPFFLYVGQSGPHDPMLARQEIVDKYAPGDDIADAELNPFYTMGYTEYGRQVEQRQVALGIIDAPVLRNPNFTRNYDDWDESMVPDDELRRGAKRMAIHAAMMTQMDEGFGAIVKALKKFGYYDDTLIMVLSDNGAEQLGLAEGGQLLQNWGDAPGQSPLNTPGRYDAKGWAWANNLNSPWNGGKYSSWRGGSNTPLVVSWPQQVPAKRCGTIDNTPIFVTDFMPTFLELFDDSYPDFKLVDGVSYAIPRPEGRSFLSCIVDEQPAAAEYPFGYVASTTTFGGDAFLWKDGWKLMRIRGQTFNVNPQPGAPNQLDLLFDLTTDAAEQFDLSKERPDKFAELLADYADWESRTRADPSIAAAYFENTGDPQRVGALSGVRTIPESLRQGFVDNSKWNESASCSTWFDRAKIVRTSFYSQEPHPLVELHIRFCEHGVETKIFIERGDRRYDPYEHMPVDCVATAEHNHTYAYWFDDLRYLRTEKQALYNGTLSECYLDAVGQQIYQSPARIAIRFNEFFNESITRSRVVWPIIIGIDTISIEEYEQQSAMIVQANGLNNNALNGLWTDEDLFVDELGQVFTLPRNPASTFMEFPGSDIGFATSTDVSSLVLDDTDGERPLFGPFKAVNPVPLGPIGPQNGLISVESPTVEAFALGPFANASGFPAALQFLSGHLTRMSQILASGVEPYNNAGLVAEYNGLAGAGTQFAAGIALQSGIGAQNAVDAYEQRIQNLPPVKLIN